MRIKRTWALQRYPGALCVGGTVILLAACGAPDETVGQSRTELVYDDDNREEVHESTSPVARSLAAESIVAFIRNDNLDEQNQLASSVMSWSDANNLCPGERFGAEPAAAFCTGILVDWDLVLTAGHCVRLFALNDFSVAFGYYYSKPKTLEISEVRYPEQIVDERLDLANDAPRLDYAWVRLDRPIEPQMRPAAIRGRSAEVAVGTSLISISAVGGVPLKVDEGGSVIDSRSSANDYFVTDTDTASGSSGGGVFDESGALIGVLARGGTDSFTTERGCQTTVMAKGKEASEQYTYASQALAALCETDASASALCRQDCTHRCQAERDYMLAGGGCTITSPGQRSPRSFPVSIFVSIVIGFLKLVVRRRRGATS